MLNPQCPPHRADMGVSLDRDWSFDSLARAELFLRVERAFGVSLPEPPLIEAETWPNSKRRWRRICSQATFFTVPGSTQASASCFMLLIASLAACEPISATLPASAVYSFAAPSQKRSIAS